MLHHFNVRLATDFSLEIATLITNIEHLTKNKLVNYLATDRPADKTDIHEGHCWIYYTLIGFTKFHPYLKKGQVERILSKCIDAGLLLTGNYNKKKYDRTKWYAMTMKAFEYFPESLTPELRKLLIFPISRKQEMDFPKVGNGFPEIGTPIPYRTTNITKHSNSNSKEFRTNVTPSEPPKTVTVTVDDSHVEQQPQHQPEQTFSSIMKSVATGKTKTVNFDKDIQRVSKQLSGTPDSDKAALYNHALVKLDLLTAQNSNRLNGAAIEQRKAEMKERIYNPDPRFSPKSSLSGFMKRFDEGGWQTPNQGTNVAYNANKGGYKGNQEQEKAPISDEDRHKNLVMRSYVEYASRIKSDNFSEQFNAAREQRAAIIKEPLTPEQFRAAVSTGECKLLKD
jgi:hypothetical protein